MNDVIDWFEIPTLDLERAVRFYETVLGARFKRETSGGPPQAMFVGKGEAPFGALVQDPRRKPAMDGALVYLSAGTDLDGCIERAARAGGRVVLPRTDIGDPGFIAIVADSEGNTVGLHAEREAR
jgi:predicted enzyme related to lactoylglutathione lyase